MKILKNILFWIFALVLTLSMAIYQRKTGPTHPITGSFELAGERVEYSIKRTQGGDIDHAVVIPVTHPEATATLFWKRYLLDEPYASVEMTHTDSAKVYKSMHSHEPTFITALVGHLPKQPPAGKLEYYVVVSNGEDIVQLPENGETAVLRYKGEVPGNVLVPHIFAMFFAMLFSTRVAIAVLAKEKTRILSWITLGLLVVGGLILGPIVQNYAFGAYWTGWPLGEDLTDNKLALAVLAWAIAIWRLSIKNGERRGRWFAFAAAFVLLGTYMIPHSARGSSFDYNSGEVTTGKEVTGQVMESSEAEQIP